MGEKRSPGACFFLERWLFSIASPDFTELNPGHRLQETRNCRDRCAEGVLCRVLLVFINVHFERKEFAVAVHLLRAVGWKSFTVPGMNNGLYKF